jgi:integrase/recombinase XerC
MYQVESWENVTHPMLRSWLVSLAKNKISANSINRKVSSVKSLYLYMKRKGAVNKNPTSRIVSLKKEKRLPVTVNERSIHKLLHFLKEKEGFEGIRDRLMVELFYQTGMRRSELISLKHKDIDHVLGQLKVTGKGNKQRIIPIGPSLSSLIRQYETEKDQEFGKDSSALLIVTDKGLQLYPKFVYNRITKLISLVSSAEKRNPHVLRHSFATHLSNRGAELNAIKELLGHESLAATQIYTHNSIEKLKKAYQKAHPKS